MFRLIHKMYIYDLANLSFYSCRPRKQVKGLDKDVISMTRGSFSM